MKQKRNKLINIINVLKYELCNKTVFETIKSVNVKYDMCNKKQYFHLNHKKHQTLKSQLSKKIIFLIDTKSSIIICTARE